MRVCLAFDVNCSFERYGESEPAVEAVTLAVGQKLAAGRVGLRLKLERQVDSKRQWITHADNVALTGEVRITEAPLFLPLWA